MGSGDRSRGGRRALPCAARAVSAPRDLGTRFRQLVAAPGAGGAAGVGPQALTVLAAALVAGQLALLVWHLVPGATRRPPPPVRAPNAGAANDIDDIVRAHPFGAADAGPASGGDAPRTRVALILAGTLAVSDPRQGLAIVGETAQGGKLYAVGAMLPGGVKLHEVYTDRVVLERDGALEMLPLPRQFSANGRPGPALSPPGNAGEPALADSVQKLIAQGPEVIGEVLRPMPMYANGQLKGFRVYAGRDRQKFAKLGLKANDLVTQINGVPLTDAQRGMEILRTLGNAGSAQITVERGGATQQLSVDASTVAGLSQPSDPAMPPPQESPAAAPTPE